MPIPTHPGKEPNLLYSERSMGVVYSKIRLANPYFPMALAK